MNAAMNSVMALAGGLAWAAICTLGLRSDWYLRSTMSSVLKSRRQPVTPDAIEEGMRGLKLALVFGIVLGVVAAFLGALGLVIPE